MSDWEDVPQGRANPSLLADPARVRVTLTQRGSGIVLMNVSIGTDVVKQLGWQRGQGLGLAAGGGAMAGWVRLAAKTGGRVLRHAGLYGKTAGLVAQFRAPDAYQSTIAPRTEAEHRIEKGALLVKLPWPPADIVAQDEAAEAEQPEEPASEPEAVPPAPKGETVAAPDAVIRQWVQRNIPLYRLGETISQADLDGINVHRKKRGLTLWRLKAAA